jgi:glycosyltransferase involved in cell wall biosynthesis
MPDLSVTALVVSHGFQANYERGFCNGLNSAGVRVTLVTGECCDRSGLAPEIKVIPLRGSQDERRSRWRKLLNMVRYHLSLLILVARRRHEVVHVIGLIEPPWVVGVLEGFLMRLLCRRYVLTVHDLLPHDRHSARVLRASRLAYQMPHHLVVHTAKMATELRKRFGVRSSKVTVMPHGLEPVGAQAQDRERMTARPVVRLLCFGHVARYKGIDVLVDAMRLVTAPCELHISGTCRDPGLAAELTARIAASPSSAGISWSSRFVTEAEMAALFRGSDVVVLPYRHIDQSGVLIQALRFGVPVVATKVGSLEEYVTPEVGERCEPESATSLAAAIDRLASRLHSIDRANIAKQASALDWSTVVSVLQRAYHDPRRRHEPGNVQRATRGE